MNIQNILKYRIVFMKKNILALFSGFLIIFVGNALISIFILNNISSKLGIARTIEQGLNFPALASGYLLATIGMVWLSKKIDFKSCLHAGLEIGIFISIVFNIAPYLMISGWSTANASYMLLASIVDSIATILAAIVVTGIIKK